MISCWVMILCGKLNIHLIFGPLNTVNVLIQDMDCFPESLKIQDITYLGH